MSERYKRNAQLLLLAAERCTDPSSSQWYLDTAKRYQQLEAQDLAKEQQPPRRYTDG